MNIPVVEMGRAVPTVGGGSVSFVCVTRHGYSTLHAMNEDYLAVGTLKWDTTSFGEVTGVYVHERWRRRGIATLLWEAAGEVAREHQWPELVHSHSRTADGDAWARSIGGELPDLADGEFTPPDHFGF